MKTHDTHISAPPSELFWRRTVPGSTSAKIILLTTGGVAVVGSWYGAIGQYFTAWCPLPADKAIKNNPSPLALRVAQLEAELAHWKNNHADLVNRAALLSQRPDLPVDRLPAYREMRHLQLIAAEYRKRREREAALVYAK